MKNNDNTYLEIDIGDLTSTISSPDTKPSDEAIAEIHNSVKKLMQFMHEENAQNTSDFAVETAE